MNEEKRTLEVNCGLACLLNDREGILDNYDRIKINCGTAIVSSAINAKLSAKGAKINSGDMHIRDIKGEIIQLDKGAAIDGSADLKGFFIIAKDDLLVKKDGTKAIENAEGLIALGTIFYPESAGLSSLIKVSGEKKPYPDDAYVILGDHKLETLAAAFGEGKKHLWVSGRLTALDKKPLEHLRSKGYLVSCTQFFSYEGLNTEFGDLINSMDRILAPDGYEITGKIGDGELGLYGKKIYVDGNFSMNENDIPALEELEAVIVKGAASLPFSAVRIFKSKGRAESYFVFEGRLVKVNGFEQFSHSQLDASAKKREKITLLVNGCLAFDEDVTPEDIESIVSLSYNGTVLISGPAKSELAGKVKTGNGFMGDPARMEEMTGQNIKQFAGRSDEDSKGTKINLGTYILA